MTKTKVQDRQFLLLLYFCFFLFNFECILPLSCIADDDNDVEKELKSGRIPSNFIKVNNVHTSHILLVEKSNQTLYHYRIGKKIELVNSYFCSTGQAPGRKTLEGDLRTPVGVYFFTAIKEKIEGLLPKYGFRAFVTDYPNDFDRILGNNGYGIWLHGSDQDNRVQLTFDSEGCVVLDDEDLKTISPYISLKKSPIIIVQDVKYLNPVELEPLQEELENFLENWISVWKSKDVDLYMNCYSKKFISDDMNWDQWYKHKNTLNQQYKSIDISIDNLNCFYGDGQYIVHFNQIYQSNTYSDIGTKRLYLNKEDNNWKIIGEYWEPATSLLSNVNRGKN